MGGMDGPALTEYILGLFGLSLAALLPDDDFDGSLDWYEWLRSL